jgi:hypothetical protein
MLVHYIVISRSKVIERIAGDKDIAQVKQSRKRGRISFSFSGTIEKPAYCLLQLNCCPLQLCVQYMHTYTYAYTYINLFSFIIFLSPFDFYVRTVYSEKQMLALQNNREMLSFQPTPIHLCVFSTTCGYIHLKICATHPYSFYIIFM